jgi:hypothetical protein
MLVKVDWYDSEKTIVHQVYEGKLTAEDLLQSTAQTEALYQSVGRHIFVMTDFTLLKGAPGSILPVMKQLERISYVKDSTIFVVAASNYITVLGQIVKSLAPGLMRDITFVHKLSDATQKIAELRNTPDNV